MRLPIVLLAVICAAHLPPQAGALIGSWHGTSTCVDKVRFPACHDEEVIYDFTKVNQSTDTVLWKADKVVNGRRESMGELSAVRESGGSWSAEFQTPRVHDRWELQISDSMMTGRLLDLPGRTLVRRVSLRRMAPT